MSDGSSALLIRLHARRDELEEAVRARVYEISDPGEVEDPIYLEGLRTAISIAIDYGMLAAERGEERAPPSPPTLLAQARLAARAGIALDTILRRYLAGHSLLTDVLLEEAERAGLPPGDLRRLLRSHGALFERLIATIGDEYRREMEKRLESAEQRRAHRVRQLLEGELLDTSGFAYDFGDRHVGLIAVGASAAKAIRAMSAELDCRLLLVPHDGGTTWAWIGSRRRLDPGELRRQAKAAACSEMVLAIGESGAGMRGWRLTHRQARAALPVALRTPERIARYADVALLASALQDELLATSLREMYLTPLSSERNDIACETLRAYFDAGRNISSAAAALGVNRNTVGDRLRAIETRLCRSIVSCAAELEVALRLDRLESADFPPAYAVRSKTRTPGRQIAVADRAPRGDTALAGPTGNAVIPVHLGRHGRGGGDR